MTLRQILPRLAWLAGPPAAVGLSLWARHGWVQAHELAVWCEQHANQHPCPWRDAVIQAFIDHRLSTAAFVLAGIAWMAQDHNVQVVPHGWNTAIGLAADLQISAFLPNARYVEYLTPCAYIDELTTEPFIIDADGCLQIPDRPGLGVEIDPAKLKRFCPQRLEFR